MSVKVLKKIIRIIAEITIAGLLVFSWAGLIVIFAHVVFAK